MMVVLLLLDRDELLLSWKESREIKPDCLIKRIWLLLHREYKPVLRLE